MDKTLDTQFAHLELQDDLLIAHYKKGIRISLDIAKQIVKTRLNFTGSKPVLGLIYNEGVKKIDKDARDYLTSEEGTFGITAVAYVLNNPFPFSSFFANFFVSISKTNLPVRIFSSEKPALKWLAQFRK